MSRDTREERRKRKKERMNRDKDDANRSFSGSYALGKHGFEFDFFKEERGNALEFHILPYIIRSENHPEVVAGRMEIGDEDYFLEFGIHRGIGPQDSSSVLCLDMTFGKPCPICEHARELKADGSKQNLPWPSRRVLYNVMENRTDEIKIFEVSEKLFHRELKGKLSRSERGFFDYSDLEDGAMIKCWVDENRSGRFKFSEFKDFEFVDRDPLPEEILDRSIALEMLLNIPTYEQVEQFYNGEITTIDYREASAEDEKPQEKPREERVKRSEKRKEPEKGEEAKEERKPRKKKGELSYGSECPYGLIFGEDFDTDRKKCGIECDDETYAKCEEAYESYEEDQ